MNTEIRNWPHFAMEMLSILMLVCCFIPLLKIGQFSGSEVPVHVDITGAVDRTGKASDLIFLPIMALFMFAVLTLAEKFPKLINAPKKLSERGKEYLYRQRSYSSLLISPCSSLAACSRQERNISNS